MLLPRVSMMIRDNARLFFLYALRSNASCEESLRPQDFFFRLARKGDIGAIRDCNLRTLPENYTPQFYEAHVGDWPELALVAEHVSRHASGDESEVVGYVLGRMEDKTFPGFRDSISPGPATGHVTSLAVLPGYRRCGVAHQLMINLHQQMEVCYQAKRVSLHVRKSNRGAIRLYEQILGYEVHSVAKGYYSDGEDAYLMQVDLPLKPSTTGGDTTASSQSSDEPLFSGATSTIGGVTLTPRDAESSPNNNGPGATAAVPVMTLDTRRGFAEISRGGGGSRGREEMKEDGEFVS